MSETKLTVGRVRKEMAQIEHALERLEKKLDRLFPGARSLPGEGCILRETIVCVGQASSYISGFRFASKDHIAGLIEELALSRATPREGE